VLLLTVLLLAVVLHAPDVILLVVRRVGHVHLLLFS
jgi:hypothetical protein